MTCPKSAGTSVSSRLSSLDRPLVKTVINSDILPLHPHTYPTGSLYHNTTKMCKQVPSHPHPYQKLPDIHLIRSVPFPICTFTNCLFVSLRAVQTFCVHRLLFRYLLLSCSIVLFVLTTTRLNKTTTTTSRIPLFVGCV